MQILKETLIHPPFKYVLYQKDLNRQVIWQAKKSLIRQVLVTKSTETRPWEKSRQRWLNRVKRYLNQVEARVKETENPNRWKYLVDSAKYLKGF